jgi:hypothetical protein
MQRTGDYEERESRSESRMAPDVVDRMAGNFLVLVLAGMAIAAGVIGMLVAFDIIGTTGDQFNNGILWLAGGLILAISANAFRREVTVPYVGSGGGRTRSRTTTEYQSGTRGTYTEGSTGVTDEPKPGRRPER